MLYKSSSASVTRRVKTKSDYKECCIGMQDKKSLVPGSALRVKRLCRLLSFIHIYGTVVRSAWKDVQQFENVAQLNGCA